MQAWDSARLPWANKRHAKKTTDEERDAVTTQRRSQWDTDHERCGGRRLLRQKPRLNKGTMSRGVVGKSRRGFAAAAEISKGQWFGEERGERAGSAQSHSAAFRLEPTSFPTLRSPSERCSTGTNEEAVGIGVTISAVAIAAAFGNVGSAIDLARRGLSARSRAGGGGGGGVVKLTGGWLPEMGCVPVVETDDEAAARGGKGPERPSTKETE
ncbi:unnamed protein product [Lampetra fluviatilis]